MDWNPDRYLSFREQRFLPFDDLIAGIRPDSIKHIADLGCGTGDLTVRLAERFPGSRVLGIDKAASMLERAQTHSPVTFVLGSIEEFAAGAHPALGDHAGWDLVFSHAALHWVEDHPALFGALWERLRPGGQLAVQMPANHDHPAQRAVAELAQEEPYRSALEGFVRRSPVLPARDYASLLFELGAQHIGAYEKIYPHVLDDAAAVVEWTRGTFLLPYLTRLDESLGERFLGDYAARVKTLMPGAPVFYGFKRVLLHAVKGPG